jgi:hypothetical protein
MRQRNVPPCTITNQPHINIFHFVYLLPVLWRAWSKEFLNGLEGTAMPITAEKDITKVAFLRSDLQYPGSLYMTNTNH